MEKKPLISVIVPVYKVEQYLSRCVESVLRQNLDDFELLLVDDGSPDNSGVICDEWAEKDSRIRVFHQKNAGQSGARNTGLDHAAGRYAVFIDSDDYVTEDYLENLYCLISSPADKGLGFAFQGYKKYSEAGELLETTAFVPRVYTRNDLISLFDGKNIFAACSKIFDCTYLNKYQLRFNTRLGFNEDLPFILECMMCCDYVAVGDKTDYAYINHTGTLSKVVNPFKVDHVVFSYCKSVVRKFVVTFDLSPDQRKDLYMGIHYIFDRTPKCDYHYIGSISGKTRRENLRRLVDEDMDYLSEFYTPPYLVDKLGRRLLMSRLVWLYDLFISTLFRLKFQRMSCPPGCF